MQIFRHKIAATQPGQCGVDLTNVLVRIIEPFTDNGFYLQLAQPTAFSSATQITPIIFSFLENCCLISWTMLD